MDVDSMRCGNSRHRRIELQWSHVLMDVDRTRAMTESHWRLLLQWSHVLMDVDRLHVGQQNITRIVKLQWSHVLMDVDRRMNSLTTQPLRCFNGATS